MSHVGSSRKSFKQADITRALKAAKKAGLEIASTEIKPDGTLLLVYAGDVPGIGSNEWDEVLQ